jgi:hypothetical protein
MLKKKYCGNGHGVGDELWQRLAVARVQTQDMWQLTGVKSPLQLAVNMVLALHPSVRLRD